MPTTQLDPQALLLLRSLADHLPDGRVGQLITVFDVQGSAPRGPGARMLVADQRLLAGTIGGGRLEEQAIDGAAKWLVEAAKTRLLRRFQLGPELAQCCGGVVELLIETVDSGALRRLADEVETRRQQSLPLVQSIGDRALTEHVGTPKTVVVFGAGHVGTALCQAMAVLPWRVIVVDSRPEWADVDRFVAGVEVVAASPVAVLASWGWLGSEARRPNSAGADWPTPPPPHRTHAVVMTHDHGVDRDLADALLQVAERTQGPPLSYVGVIGSKTKIAVLRRRLADRGLTDHQLQRLTAPIGLRLDGQLFGGKLPGQIAISVAAQLMQWPA